MKKKVIWLGLGLLTAAAMLLASCGTSSETPSMPTTSTGTSTTGVVLTVTNGSTTKTYTLADLRALPSTTGTGGTLLSGVNPCQGVAVIDLLNAVGGITAGQSISISAAHNYNKTITYDQLTNSTFNYYDKDGNKVTPTASIRLNIDNNEVLEAGIGIGPVDAALLAVRKSIKDFADIELEEYHVDAITGGTDALIDVVVKLKHEGNIVTARSTQPDIIMASVEAYLGGINKILGSKYVKKIKEGDL